jgi:regulator of cell morphogenesis and NO signaling
MNYPDQTLSAIVTNQFQAAAVFEKYALDFCCKGKQTLRQACQSKNISLDEVVADLDQVSITGNTSHDNLFRTMTAAQLIDYIMLRHHHYVKESIPVIYAHLEKVATKHGEIFPYMQIVFRLFASVSEEMISHLDKEEAILFPAIKEKEKSRQSAFASVTSQCFSIKNVLYAMEKEHEQAGEWMDQIRQLTNNYTAPVNACTTFRVSLAELKEFEQDLHRHVHLENHLLFPMAMNMS